jgi:hypothetical protein
MSNARSFMAVTLACVLSSAPALAAETAAADASQTQQKILLDTIRANRKALVAVSLQLSPEQEKSFWPLYDQYEKEIGAIGDRVAAIIDDYTASFRDLGDDKAMKLMEDYLAAEADRAQVRRKYLPEFAKVLPGRAVARFYQIENKMDALLRYELASTIPVVDEKGAAPAK